MLFFRGDTCLDDRSYMIHQPSKSMLALGIVILHLQFGAQMRPTAYVRHSPTLLLDLYVGDSERCCTQMHRYMTAYQTHARNRAKRLDSSVNPAPQMLVRAIACYG
jgi:hypothetical protein